MNWPDAPKCYHCEHPETGESGRPMTPERVVQDVITVYTYSCDGCGTKHSVDDYLSAGDYQ